MATQWWREPWRKLYTKLDAKWLGLTVSARGLADELIKYADEQGRLFEVADAKEAGKEIALRLSAKPREYKRIAEDTADLLKDTYLIVVDGILIVRNLEEAQKRRSPEAIRQAKKRERDRLAQSDRDSNADEDRDISRDGDRDSHAILSRDKGVTTPRDCHRDTIRSEPIRDEKISLPPPARAYVDNFESQTRWSEAWEMAKLPGHPLLHAVMADWRRLPDDQRMTPEECCALYRQLVAARIESGHVPNVGAEHMLKSLPTLVQLHRGEVTVEKLAGVAEKGTRRALPASTSVSDETRAARKF